MAVRMELSRILIQELKDLQIIELREVAEASPDGGGGGADPDPEGTKAGTVSQVENGRSFPIVIGLPEAHAIERRLKGIVISRPQTHDLLANVIKALGGELESITINDLQESTFFATLNVKTGGGKVIHIDSRPSDAIALGIAGNVPIYVAEHVLERAQRDDDEK
ncbi:MAG: bifunctional nuclease family protein [Phycisphaerales bacterium]